MRRLRTRIIKRKEATLGQRSRTMRNILSDIRDGSKVMRTRARTKFKKKEKFLVGKYGLKDDVRTKGLD